MNNTIKTLEHRYMMNSMGYSEQGDERHYNKIGLQFQIFRPLSKDEGRKILIDSAEELLTAINTTPEMLSFLEPSPFTYLNVEIVIFTYHSNGQSTYYPDIAVFADRRGIIRFATEREDMKYDYYTEEEETFEEALKIVQAQAQPQAELPSEMK